MHYAYLLALPRPAVRAAFAAAPVRIEAAADMHAALCAANAGHAQWRRLVHVSGFSSAAAADSFAWRWRRRGAQLRHLPPVTAQLTALAQSLDLWSGHRVVLEEQVAVEVARDLSGPTRRALRSALVTNERME